MSSGEAKQRITVFGICLIAGVIFVAVMSVLFTRESGLGIFLLDRAANYYPFTIQNVMWLMFWVGCGELYVAILSIQDGSGTNNQKISSRRR